MANTVFDVVRGALEEERSETEKQIDVLGSFQANISRQAGLLKSLVKRLVGSVKGLLGQFSNKAGYSDAELGAVAAATVDASLSNQAGVVGRGLSDEATPEGDYSAQVQETISRFHSSLLSDPLNTFVLPRVVYDNMTTRNVERAEALNEAYEAVGLGKLMHDAIPVEYYDALSLEVLVTAKPQLLEVARSLTLACGAITSGSDPSQLIESIENDFEAVIRFIARESVYDASQFSSSEYLSLIERIKAAADVLEASTEVIEESKVNILDYQSGLLSTFNNTFSECGTLATAIGTIEGVAAHIDELSAPDLYTSEALSIVATKGIVLQLVTALAAIQDFVRKQSTLESVLTTEASTERTKFEASQTAVSSVPTLSPTLPEDLRAYARALEQRLSSPTVSSQVSSLFNAIVAEIPAEFAKGEDLQVAFNDYDIDVTEENKSMVVKSLEDIKELGLNRMFEAALLGRLTVLFDTSTSRASKIGYAAQEVALALEGALTGVSLALGGCKIAKRGSAQRLSTMLAEFQDTLQVRVYAQLSFREALQRRLRILKDKKLKRISRFIEELGGISLAERCG